MITNKQRRSGVKLESLFSNRNYSASLYGVPKFLNRDVFYYLLDFYIS